MQSKGLGGVDVRGTRVEIRVTQDATIRLEAFICLPIVQQLRETTGCARGTQPQNKPTRTPPHPHCGIGHTEIPVFLRSNNSLRLRNNSLSLSLPIFVHPPTLPCPNYPKPKPVVSRSSDLSPKGWEVAVNENKYIYKR